MLPLQASVSLPSARSWRRDITLFDPFVPALLRLCACQLTRALIVSSYMARVEGWGMSFSFHFLSWGGSLFSAARRRLQFIEIRELGAPLRAFCLIGLFPEAGWYSVDNS